MRQSIGCYHDIRNDQFMLLWVVDSTHSSHMLTSLFAFFLKGGLWWVCGVWVGLVGLRCLRFRWGRGIILGGDWLEGLGCMMCVELY